VDIRLKRAYEPASPSDGYRVLIDRLWPRGLSKKRAKLDEWEKELPPSTELRTWFGHEPSRFPEFRRRYISELGRKRSRLTELRNAAAATTEGQGLARPLSRPRPSRTRAETRP
jgi:uncharacterized protein YeaO (DUF488 family)